jgi:hypothetical protein
MSNYHYSDMQSIQILTEDLSGIVAFAGQSTGKRLHVDREKGIIKGVKIIGFNSQNGRKYTPEALKEAVPMYEGIKVNIDHPESGPTQQRSSHDRFGKFINVRFQENEGVFGDLLYLKNHPLAESVCEAAEREELNDVFGMSHNAQGEGMVDKKNVFVVSKITEVRHVDLVADPATTKSLTESQSPTEQEAEEAAGNRVRYKSKRQAVGAKRKFTKAKSKGAVKPTGTLKEAEMEPDNKVSVSKDENFKKQLHIKVMRVLSKNDTADDKKADELIDLVSKEIGGKEMSATESIDENRNMESQINEAKKDPDMEDEDDGKKTSVKVDASKDDEIEEASSVCEKCGSSYSKMEAKEEEDEDEEDEGHEDEKQDKKMMKKEIKKAMKESKDPSERLAYYETKEEIREICEANNIDFEETFVDDLSGLTRASKERLIKRMAAANAKPKCSPTQATFQESKSGSKLPEGESLFRWLSN